MDHKLMEQKGFTMQYLIKLALGIGWKENFPESQKDQDNAANRAEP